MILKHCAVCNKVIKSGDFLCEECRQDLKNDEFDSFMDRCEKCGFPKLDTLYQCQHCKEFQEFFVYPIFDYSLFFAKRVLENYKFRGERRLRFFIADVFARKIEYLYGHGRVIVPIPSSLKSVKKRGWDQMKEVSKVLHRKYGYNVEYLLKADKHSEEQKTLSREQRTESSKNKFSLIHSDRIFEDKSIVLIDDVCTTGSTLKSAKEVLKEAGFSDVSAVTLFAEL